MKQRVETEPVCPILREITFLCFTLISIRRGLEQTPTTLQTHSTARIGHRPPAMARRPSPTAARRDPICPRRNRARWLPYNDLSDGAGLVRVYGRPARVVFRPAVCRPQKPVLSLVVQPQRAERYITRPGLRPPALCLFILLLVGDSLHTYCSITRRRGSSLTD
jgi:hypothetical protein